MAILCKPQIDEMKQIFVTLFLLVTLCSTAQTRWINPQTDGAKLHGQLLQDEPRTNYYQRLPDRVKDEVTPAVWNLSLNTAGESLQFYTNSKRIVVRYTLAEGHSFPHMPATGKSGVDLYAYDEHGKEKWCAARYSFADTTRFSFETLFYDKPMHSLGYEYHLYLPPYNTVKWMEIGVDSAAFFRFIEPSVEKPIIAYGTSITQGACASRPAMIWSTIVSREMQTPLVNLGFSGNGLLAQGILDVIKQTPAKAVILDCMPNLSTRDEKEITDLVINAVREIRSAQPNVPILIVDHLGYPHSTMIDGFQQRTDNSIKAQSSAINQLKAEGVHGVHYLTYDEIGMPQDATVEAIHPSDFGMRVYADAYIKKLREILSEPIGELSSQIPVRQRREPGNYEWRERHESLLNQVRSNPPKVVIFGNSITHFWGGNGGFRIQTDSVSWNQKVAPMGALNMGFGWDCVENVLWRVYHGALDGYKAEKVIVAIGINNILANRDSVVAQGIRTLIGAIRHRQPTAEIVINGIYPARDREQRVAKVNSEIAKVTKECGVRFNNFSHLLLGKDGKIDKTLFSDGVHLTPKGYRKIADAFVK